MREPTTDSVHHLSQLVSGLLEPGESILAAVRGRRLESGHDRGRPAEAYVGRIGAVLGPRMPRRLAPIDPETGLPAMPPLPTLALTDRRLLVFARSPITGRTRDYVGAIPRSRIRTVEVGARRVRRRRLLVRLDAGTPIEMLLARAADADGFAAAFHGDR